MFVIPVINCKNFKCVRVKLEKAAKFLPKSASRRSWVQIDVSDGKFTRAKTNFTPAQLKSLRIKNLNIEIHLMVKNPEKVVVEWFRAGAKRVIAHAEEIKSTNSQQLTINNKIGIAINPNTPVKKLFPYLKSASRRIKFVQLLAVNPGYSGQKFDKRILNKIKLLKEKSASWRTRIKIEVDGGINLETARLAKKAGADIIVSGSYIWNNKNPGKIYRELSTVR